MTTVKYRKADVEGLKIFYREAGPADAPMLLLLHGFPSAGHMFRDLIPQLASQFHVIAPDLPGFGQSDIPHRDKFHYTFDNIARVIGRFAEVSGLSRFAVYVFDYGAPTGFRLAARHPERITAYSFSMRSNSAPLTSMPSVKSPAFGPAVWRMIGRPGTSVPVSTSPE